MSKQNCKKKRNLVFDHRQLHSITKYLEVARKALAPLTINDCNWHSTNVFLVRRSSVKDELNERHSGLCRLRANLSFSFFRSLSLPLAYCFTQLCTLHANPRCVFFRGAHLHRMCNEFVWIDERSALRWHKTKMKVKIWPYEMSKLEQHRFVWDRNTLKMQINVQIRKRALCMFTVTGVSCCHICKLQ